MKLKFGLQWDVRKNNKNQVVLQAILFGNI